MKIVPQGNWQWRVVKVDTWCELAETIQRLSDTDFSIYDVVHAPHCLVIAFREKTDIVSDPSARKEDE